jgi:hypothetical protein
MPFFAVWRNRTGGGSWIEISAGYASRAEAETVTPQRQGIPEPKPQKLVVEAANETEVRRLYTQWENRGCSRLPQSGER